MLMGRKGKEVSLLQYENSEINWCNCLVCVIECPRVLKTMTPASSTNPMTLL